MTKSTKVTWTTERTQNLIDAVAGKAVVSQEDLLNIADSLDTTSRSIGSKLRSLVKEGSITVEVQKASEVARQTWLVADEDELKGFLAENAGTYTYSELSAIFKAGKYETKQLQGKILSLELTDAVKKAEKAAPVRTYTPEEEAIYVTKAAAGESLEAIAEALGKAIQSVRGKGLSLQREGRIAAIPTQAVSTAQAPKADFLETLGDAVVDMTVEEIAEATARSVRGVKNALSRRGVACKDHDGAARRAKIDKKGTVEAVEA